MMAAALAAPAGAEATPYCQTVTVNAPFTGSRTIRTLCGDSLYVFCEHVGTADNPPTLYVEVCAPTPFPLRGEI